jgi:hypothetical protein
VRVARAFLHTQNGDKCLFETLQFEKTDTKYKTSIKQIILIFAHRIKVNVVAAVER